MYLTILLVPCLTPYFIYSIQLKGKGASRNHVSFEEEWGWGM